MSLLVYTALWFVWAFWTMTLYARAQIISEFIWDQYRVKLERPTEVTYRETMSFCFYPVVTILWFTSNILQFGILE
jgi:hypothetical protein